jgi:hypothetical protein
MKSELTPIPNKYRPTGWFMVIAGVIAGALFFLIDLRIELPVIALISSFIETKFFTLFVTNIADELILTLLIAGLAIVIFSQEKSVGQVEDIERYRYLEMLKAKSLFKSLRYNTLFLIVSIFFVFGQGFLWVLLLNLLSVYIIYLALYCRAKRGH